MSTITIRLSEEQKKAIKDKSNFVNILIWKKIKD